MKRETSEKCFWARSPGGLCRIGREIEAVSSSLEWEKETAGTFKASPSEAAPLGPILLNLKLTDVTDLFVCETGDVRKVISAEVTGGCVGQWRLRAVGRAKKVGNQRDIGEPCIGASCGEGKSKRVEFKFRTGNINVAPSKRRQARPRQQDRFCCPRS